MRTLILGFLVFLSNCSMPIKYKYSSCDFDDAQTEKSRFSVRVIDSWYEEEFIDKGVTTCNFFLVQDFDTKDTFRIISLSPLFSKSEVEKYNLENRLIFVRNDIKECVEFYSSKKINKQSNSYSTMVGHLFYSEE